MSPEDMNYQIQQSNGDCIACFADEDDMLECLPVIEELHPDRLSPSHHGREQPKGHTMSIAKRLNQEVIEDRMDHEQAQTILDRLYGDKHEPCLFTFDKAENQENLGDFDVEA